MMTIKERNKAVQTRLRNHPQQREMILKNPELPCDCNLCRQPKLREGVYVYR